MSEVQRAVDVALSVEPHAMAKGLRESGDRFFRVLVIGDFSGRSSGRGGGSPRLEELRPIPVWTVDEAMARLRPTIEVVDPVACTLELTALDDLHPDSLIARIPSLRASIEGRRAEDVQSAADSEHGHPRPSRNRPERRSSEPPPGGFLDEVVEVTQERSDDRRRGAREPLEPWLRRIVAPHLKEAAPGEHGATGGPEEARVGLRALLRDPELRRLEALWRSLLVLARSVAAVDEARLYLLDLSRSELEDMLVSGDPRESAAFRLVTGVPSSTGLDRPYSMVVSAYDVGPDPAEILFLNRLAVLAHAVSAPLFAAASPRLLGLGSFAEVSVPGGELRTGPGWAAFRDTPAARSVAVLAPRFLARAPYGTHTDPCATFAFEEVENPEVGSYVWGNPAFLAGAAVVEAFASSGWSTSLGAARDLPGAAMHVTRSGAVGAHPTEALWPSEVVARVVEQGLTPLIGFEGETRVRVPGIHSISRPRAPLASWWSR